MSDQARGLRHVEHVMGTVFSFDIRGGPDRDLERVLRRAVGFLHTVDALFSTYRPGSVVSRLARNEIGPGRLPGMVEEVLALCEEAQACTQGCFSAWATGRLDPSGLVKGWAVERAAAMLRDAGADGACVNGGGDIQTFGEASPGEPWRIGIEDPCRPGTLLTTVRGRDFAVATSGTAERGAHITDPRTGRATSGLVSATVTGPRLTWADVYATAAVVRGPEAAEWMRSVPGYVLAVQVAPGRSDRPGPCGEDQPLSSSLWVADFE